ncbi:phage tail assembly chaperone family protein, TAC [Escherichia coli]|uniref:phage tail assembly chaperone family protein, TAC n=1 Tax=Escherichia coli TaxID=562 RepID=UPI001AB04AA3|nr:phage tail assembly chaperone family protein, TAC [Escherichia coli]MBO3239465.1 phage tail assembly chaperone family protein, TAC [Escherichia coli]
MQLTLDNLKKAGAFTGRPIEKEITWKQGEEELTATVFIRPAGYHAATQGIQASAGKIDGVAGYIAAAVCDEAGNPIFTAKDITGEADPERGALDGALTVALLVAIQEVNELGKMSSPPKMKSGVNSSSTASAAERSRKRRKGSALKSSSSGSGTAASTEA